jgi:hypothetical protein
LTVAELISLLIAASALIVSLYVLRRDRGRDRRDTFLQLHRQLIEAGVARGRRVLYETAEAAAAGKDWMKAWDSLPAEPRDEANQGLAMFDILGYYVRKGYVSKDDVFSNWGRSLLRITEAAEPYLRWRRDPTRNPDLWPYYAWLVDEARREGYRHDGPRTEPSRRR